MRFAYDQRLSPAEQRISRRGDAVTEVPLRTPATPRPGVEAVREALLHTEGFFQRESSLFGQRVPPPAGSERREAADTGKWSTSTRRGRR
ncbi:hypothetical protein HMI51_19360 [Corallococcus coralloides]|nr:hypothetical protein [Corallococcus coralloides]